MKLFALLVVFFVGAHSGLLSESTYKTSFLDFVKRHRKFYSPQQFSDKYSTFKDNLDYVRSFNGTFEVSLNEFADLTFDEFTRTYLRLHSKPDRPRMLGRPAIPQDMPEELDWRTKGAVTPPKNQGMCGSCWAFSATGALEGCHYMKTKELVSLSEENLVDCSFSNGNQGCSGGLMTQAFDWIIQNEGIMPESIYPYTATLGMAGHCKFNKSDVAATMTGYVDVQEGDELDLQAKAYVGPVSVALDASHRSFQFYKSGVYNEPKCDPDDLDHGVLLVGWGESSQGQFWIVKNSWGASWGEKGYIRMKRNANNHCGIATMATLPHC